MKVVAEKSGPITTVTINRPDVRNAVDVETAGLLVRLFREFEADEEARVAVLRGTGGCFCAGYDLKSLSGEGIPYEPEGQGPLGVSRMLLEKPVIAAVDGYAVAGGLELALWCDLRVMDKTAVFGVFCRRWGVPLVDGGTVRLPRLIGHSRALDMILTGRAVGAEEAKAWGLANRVVPAGTVHRAADELAREIARFPQLCMRTDHMSSYHQWGADLMDALRAEGRAGARPLREEAVAGAKRFAAGKGRGGSFENM
jgi:enoyl-CoA hydratase